MDDCWECEDDFSLRAGFCVAKQQRHVLVVHELAPSRFAGSNLRIRQICEWFCRRMLWEVTVAYRASTGAADLLDASKWASAEGVALLEDDEMFSTVLSRRNDFDVVILGVWFYHPSGRSIPEILLSHFSRFGNMSVLLLSDDVHFERCRQQQQPPCDHVDVRGREASIYKSSVVKGLIGVTSEDADVFRSQFGVTTAVWLPMLVDHVSQSVVAKRKRSPVQKIIFIGSYHPSNSVVVSWMMDVLYPALQDDFDLKSASLVLLGAREWHLMLEGRMHKDRERFKKISVITKRVSDLESTVLTNSSIFLVPNGFSGTGISTKVFSALQNRLPVVTNRAGLQGVCLVPSDKVYIAEMDDVQDVLVKLKRAFSNETPDQIYLDSVVPVNWESNTKWMDLLLK